MATSPKPPKPNTGFGDSTPKGNTGLGGASAPQGNTGFGEASTPAPAAPTTPKSVYSPNIAKLTRETLPPKMSFGQTVLNALFTPLYGVTGAVDASLENLGKAFSGDLNNLVNPLERGAQNVDRVWNGLQQPVITGKDVFEKRVLPATGIPNYQFELDVNTLKQVPVIGDMLKWSEAEASSKAGNQVSLPERTKAGELSDYLGFATDVALDPLTYVPLRAITTPLKVGAKSAAAGIGALKQGAAGEIALTRAAKNLAMTPNDVAAKVAQVEGKVNVRKGMQGATRIPQNLYGLGGKADEKLASALKKVEDQYTYKSVLTSNLGLTRTASDAIASAAEASWNALRAGIATESAKGYLMKYAARDIKGVFNPTQVVKFSRDAESGLVVLKTGNGVEITRAADMKQAREFAKAYRENAPMNSVAGATVKGAVIAEDSQSISVPRSDGSEVSLEIGKVYDEGDGNFAIFDGTNVHVFDELQKAQSYLDIYASPAAQAAEVVISQKGKKYIVTQGSNTTSFTSKGRAEAYAESLKTGATPARTATPVASGKLLLDSPAKKLEVEELLKYAPAEETSVLRAVLSDLDKTAKSIKGLTSSVSGDLRSKISYILSPSRARLDDLMLRFTPETMTVLQRVANDEITPFDALAIMDKPGSGKQMNQLSIIIKSAALPKASPKATIGEAFDRVSNFNNLSKTYGKKGENIEIALVDFMREEFFNRATALKNGTIEVGSNADALYGQLSQAVGKEIADAVKATGFLEARNPSTTEKVKEVLNNLSVKSEAIKYVDYEDMLAGLKRGDEISLNALEKIFKLIDPDRKLIDAVEKGADEPAQAFLRRVLTDNGGVATIREVEKKLALAGEPGYLLKAQGIGYSDIVGSFMRNILEDGTDAAKAALAKEFSDAAGFVSTRQAAAERINQNWQSWSDQVANAINRSFMGDAKEGGKGGIYDFLNEIETSPGFITKVTTLGDEAASSVAEAYGEGSRVLLTNQLNQYISQKVKASLLGTTKSREGAKAAKLNDAYVGKTSTEKIDLLVDQMDMANDMFIATMGSPLTIAKSRKDSAFEAAYQQAVKEAEETGGVVNFSAAANKHIVFLHTGDILRAIQLAGGELGESALARGYFPTDAVNFKTDVMAWISLDDAARRVLEMHAAGEPINVTEIATRLLVRGDSQFPANSKKVKEFEKVAKELADILTNETSINLLKTIHTERAAATALSHIDQAEGFAKEIFETLRAGWRANFIDSNISQAARAELAQQYFRKFVYASGIMKARGGDIAETLFRASAMIFTRGGKLLPESQLSNQALNNPDVARLVNLLDAQELYAFRQEVAKVSRKVAPDTAPPAGRAGTKKPSAKSKEAAQIKLTEAELAYEKSYNDFQALPADTPEAAIRAWEKSHLRAQRNLDAAREKAWTNWLPTRHFDTNKGRWVDSEQYNRNAVLRAAEQDYNRYVAGVQGVKDREVYLADSQPVIPEHTILSGPKKEAWLKKFFSETKDRQTEIASAINADVARNVLDELEAGAFDKFNWMTETEKLHRATQEMYARSIAEQAQMPQVMGLRTKYLKTFEATPRNRGEFNRKYRQELDEATPVLPGDRIGVKLREIGERWYGPAGRRDLRQFLNTGESTSIVRSARFADAVTSFREKWHKSSPSYMEDFSVVFSAVRDNVDLPLNMKPYMYDMHKELTEIVDVLRGAANGINTNGIDGVSFKNALEKFGVTEKNGFGGFEKYSADELANSILRDLPFGSMPLKNQGNTGLADAWRKRQETFKNSGVDPLVSFARVMEAIQMVKFEKGIAEGVASRFSAKALGLTPDQAIKEGFVRVAAAGDDDVLRFLPDDALLHPEIASQFGSIVREFNNLYNGKKMNAFARSIMEVTSFLKATQTILRPGHHVTNVVGDASTALIMGVTKASFWNTGMRIAARYSGDLAVADYFTKTNHAGQMAELSRLFDEGEAGKVKKMIAEDRISTQDLNQLGTSSFFVYRDGKPVRQEILDTDLLNRLENAGILVQNAASNDIMALDASFRLLDANEFEATLFDKAAAASQRAQQAITKIPGDITAAYSNVIRTAHAMKVIQSRPWASIDDAIRAAADTVNKFHPTVQSLASSERKWGRLIFTYYTWMRVAQAAFIDMAVNRTGAMLVIPKAMYAVSTAQGFQPQNFGVPFEDKNALPSYYSYSVYGPNAVGPQGAQAIRPSFLPLDVLDFWAIQVDPTKSAYENLISSEGGGFALSELGAQSNILLKTAAAVTPGINLDLDTGRPANIDTPLKLRDELLSNFGFNNLLIAIGAYTPEKYLNPNTTNKLTDADRQRMINSFFSGMRPIDYNRQVNLENAKRENTDRINSDYKNKVQNFVDEKKSEGLSNDEIYYLLVQMGVKLK